MFEKERECDMWKSLEKKIQVKIGSPYNVLIVHKPIRISEASGGAFFERPKLRLQAGSSSCQSLLGNQ
jgi:hypothetical protein